MKLKFPSRNGRSDREWAKAIDAYMMSLGNSRYESAARIIVRSHMRCWILFDGEEMVDWRTGKTKPIALDVLIPALESGINDGVVVEPVVSRPLSTL